MVKWYQLGLLSELMNIEIPYKTLPLIIMGKQPKLYVSNSKGENAEDLNSIGIIEYNGQQMQIKRNETSIARDDSCAVWCEGGVVRLGVKVA